MWNFNSEVNPWPWDEHKNTFHSCLTLLDFAWLFYYYTKSSTTGTGSVFTGIDLLTHCRVNIFISEVTDDDNMIRLKAQEKLIVGFKSSELSEFNFNYKYYKYHIIKLLLFGACISRKWLLVKITKFHIFRQGKSIKRILVFLTIPYQRFNFRRHHKSIFAGIALIFNHSFHVFWQAHYQSFTIAVGSFKPKYQIWFAWWLATIQLLDHISGVVSPKL